jgi:hypothetical protein
LDRWIVEELWSGLKGAEETAELSFDATTNLEGSKECRYEVNGELLLDRRRVFNFANEFLLWFLETFDSLGTSTARMPPKLSCRHLGDCFCQEAERRGIFGKNKVEKVVEQEWNDVEQKVSGNFLPCVQWSGHACD